MPYFSEQIDAPVVRSRGWGEFFHQSASTPAITGIDYVARVYWKSDDRGYYISGSGGAEIALVGNTTTDTLTNKTLTSPAINGTVATTGLTLPAFTSGAIDMNAAIISNIGNAGTDFTSSGGLTLANALTVTTGGAVVTAGGLTVTAGNAAINTAIAANVGLKIGGATSAGAAVASVHVSGTVTSGANAETIWGGLLINPTVAKGAFTSLVYYGVQVANPGVSGAGTISDATGVYVSSQTRGATNNYGLLIDAPSGGATQNAGASIGGGVLVTGEPTIGVSGFTGFTGTADVTANSTGVGAIKFKGTTSRDSTGFLKVFVGTTAYYVPFFSAITG